MEKENVMSNQSKVSTPYEFRPIQPGDNAQVADLIRIVMTEFDCVGEGYSINDPELEDMYAAYNQKGAFFQVIVQDGKVLGCGGIAPLSGGEAHICELRKMYFYTALRGQGWGKKMLLFCLEKARELGYTQCYLETVERMSSANALYQRMGFNKSCSPVGNTGHGSCDSYYVLDL